MKAIRYLCKRISRHYFIATLIVFCLLFVAISSLTSFRRARLHEDNIVSQLGTEGLYIRRAGVTFGDELVSLRNGLSWLERVYEVGFFDRRVTENDLVLLSQLPELRHLYFRRCYLPEDGWESLRRIPKLNVLRVSLSNTPTQMLETAIVLEIDYESD